MEKRVYIGDMGCFIVVNADCSDLLHELWAEIIHSGHWPQLALLIKLADLLVIIEDPKNGSK